MAENDDSWPQKDPPSLKLRRGTQLMGNLNNLHQKKFSNPKTNWKIVSFTFFHSLYGDTKLFDNLFKKKGE